MILLFVLLKGPFKEALGNIRQFDSKIYGFPESRPQCFDTEDVQSKITLHKRRRDTALQICRGTVIHSQPCGEAG